jgi:hypothetical protein
LRSIFAVTDQGKSLLNTGNFFCDAEYWTFLEKLARNEFIAVSKGERAQFPMTSLSQGIFPNCNCVHVLGVLSHVEKIVKHIQNPAFLNF